MSPQAPLSPATNADLVRLERARDIELIDTLKSLLDRGEALDTVAAIVERRIDAGTYVISEQLAALIGRTKSASLYSKTKEQLKDNSALLALYKSGYPDPDIEKELTTRLYEAAPIDGDIWRQRLLVRRCAKSGPRRCYRR